MGRPPGPFSALPSCLLASAVPLFPPALEPPPALGKVASKLQAPLNADLERTSNDVLTSARVTRICIQVAERLYDARLLLFLSPNTQC